MKSKLIVLLVLAVTLGIGFATLSDTLKIDIGSTVNPDSELFSILFSSSSSEVTTNSITPTLTGEVSANNATIENGNNPVIKDISLEFSDTNQEVQYVFYVHNTGSYDAYLNSATFSNYSDDSSFKKCSAISGTTQSIVDTICNDIVVDLKVNDLSISSTKNNIDNHKLEKNSYEMVTLTIKYNNSTNSSTLDGDFIVEFGTISLNYNSLD